MPNKRKPTTKPPTKSKKKVVKPLSKRKNTKLKAPKHIVTQICGLNDPFCKHSIGAKYLDNSNTRSLPYTTHTRANLLTQGTGQGAVFIVPSYVYSGFNNYTTLVTNTATFTTARTASGNPTNVTHCRIVTCGLILRNVVSPLSSSGMVRIRIFYGSGGNLTTVDTLSYNCDDYFDIPLQNCKETVIILKRVDDTAQEFKYLSDLDGTSAPFAGNCGFCSVLISVDGAPVSTSVLDFELFTNVEIKLSDNDTLAQIQTPTPPYQLITASAAKVVSSSASSIFSTGIKAASLAIERFAMSSVENLLNESPMMLLGL